MANRINKKAPASLEFSPDLFRKTLDLVEISSGAAEQLFDPRKKTYPRGDIFD
jgi:hypothetical protein